MTERKQPQSSLSHNSGIHPTARIHQTAIVEEGVSIGRGTLVGDSVHIRKNTVIGENCIIGEKTYIAYDVKINSFVYICTGITIENHVMISAGTVFTNDRVPRAYNSDGHSIKTSDSTEETLETRVCQGASLGGGCTIGSGIELEEYCMIGMGSVVTHDVAPYQLVYGNPAKPRGFVCLCGEILIRLNRPLKSSSSLVENRFSCFKCNLKYILSEVNRLVLL